MPVDRAELGQQRLQQPQVAEVLAVRGGVLADQHQLADALPASQRASASISAGGRETNAPRNDGIAQKAQRRSQPEASFSGATGPAVEPAAQPEASRGPARRSRVARPDAPRRRGRVDRGERQQRAPVARRRGWRCVLAGEDDPAAVADARGSRRSRARRRPRAARGQLAAVALGHAADGDDRLAGARGGRRAAAASSVSIESSWPPRRSRRC